MTAIVDRLELERVTRLDLMLMQRFPTKAATRALRMLARKRRYGGSTINESNPEWQCLGGLEVSYSSGSTVTVRAGAALTPNPDPVTETRPGSYTPAPAEADDDAYVVADLVANTNVAPGTAIGSALTLPEWWIVYVTTELTAVETDPDRVVFNEGSGGAWVAASDLDKIKQWTLTPGVVRGAGGANLLTVAASVPANSVMIGLIRVPIGATNLSGAVFFDVRRITEDQGPNMVSGRGMIGNANNVIGDFLPTVAGSAASIVTGTWWGRIDDQLVFASTGPGGLSADDICDPSASWDGAASLTAPKVAWLYLATLSGIVPRPVRKGSNVLGTNTDEQCFMEGVLVLSSVPPKIGTTSSTAGHKGHGKIDLRPSATLHLPSFTNGGIEYAYAGLSTTSAICLGPVLYGDIDGTTGLPHVLGTTIVSPDGWFRVGLAATADIVSGDGLLDGGGLFTTISAGASGDRTVGNFEPMDITIGGTAHWFPFTGIEWAITIEGSGLGEYWTTFKPQSGAVHPVVVATSVIVRGTWEIKPQNSSLLEVVVGKISGAAPTVSSRKAIVTGYRWPYNEPLAG